MTKFEENAIIVLTRNVTAGGVTYPAGTRGVIVWIHNDGEAYEIEFPEDVVTVYAADLAQAD
jgi:hypothetical protein